MKKICVFKAQAVLRNDAEIPSVEISAIAPIPDTDSLHATAKIFADDAKMLAATLLETLPGGTIDQLLVELLRAKASQFIAVIRTLVGPGSIATTYAEVERLLALRTDVADSAIEWVLAERELAAAKAGFDAAFRATPTSDSPLEINPALQQASGRFVDAARREHDAEIRWQKCARALVEALEGRRP